MTQTMWQPQFPLLLSVCLAACGTPDAPVPEWTDPSPHEIHTAAVNNTRLQYLDWGGKGDPLVLIHGFGVSPHHFDELGPALTDQFRVIAYARRGHGRSPATPPYDVDTLTEDLRGLLDHLGVERAHLAGWSLGGNEVTRFARRYPDRVGGLVYFDAAYDWSDPVWAAAGAAYPIVWAPPEARRSFDAYRTWLQSVNADAPWSDAFEADLRDMTRELPDGAIEPVPNDSVSQMFFAQVFGADSGRRDYSAVTAPALAIYPKHWLPQELADPAGTIAAWNETHYRPFKEASIARVTRELTSVEVLRLDSGSHGSFIHTQRASIEAAMRRFLGGIVSEEGGRSGVARGTG